MTKSDILMLCKLQGAHAFIEGMKADNGNAGFEKSLLRGYSMILSKFLKPLTSALRSTRTRNRHKVFSHVFSQKFFLNVTRKNYDCRTKNSPRMAIR